MGRVVAFIDILGFKQLVDDEPTESLGERYRSTINLTTDLLNKPFPEEHDEPSLLPTLKKGQQYCIAYAFSDAVILIANDDREESGFATLLYAFKVTRQLIAMGFPVRGAVTYGDIFVDLEKRIFLGKALTQAYQLEQKQDWIGVLVDETVVDVLTTYFDSNYSHAKYIQLMFPLYCVPMKDGEVKDRRTINWRWNLVVETGTRSLFRNTDEWAAKRKIENSLKYALEMRQNNKVYPIQDDEVPIEIRQFQVSDLPPPRDFIHGDEY